MWKSLEPQRMSTFALWMACCKPGKSFTFSKVSELFQLWLSEMVENILFINWTQLSISNTFYYYFLFCFVKPNFDPSSISALNKFSSAGRASDFQYYKVMSLSPSLHQFIFVEKTNVNVSREVVIYLQRTG